MLHIANTSFETLEKHQNMEIVCMRGNVSRLFECCEFFPLETKLFNSVPVFKDQNQGECLIGIERKQKSITAAHCINEAVSPVES